MRSPPDVVRRRGGRTRTGRLALSGESANGETMPRLALGQVECQTAAVRGPRVVLLAALPRTGRSLLARAARLYDGGRRRALSGARPCCAGEPPEHVGRGDDPGGAAGARRARSSATSPTRMYFTPDGLEQATRLGVARHRAARVAAAAPTLRARPGLRHRRRPGGVRRAGVTAAGVDRDPVRVAVAAANLAPSASAAR